MAIYQLYPTQMALDTGVFEPPYDKSFVHIVRADDCQIARYLVADGNHYGDEGSVVWGDPKLTTCDLISVDGAPEHLAVETFAK